jgi:hypothetical protein
MRIEYKEKPAYLLGCYAYGWRAAAAYMYFQSKEVK